jgi:hypothetical protein
MARAWVWLIDRTVDWVRAPAISRAGCFRDVGAWFGAEASIPGTATAHVPVNVAGTARNRQFGAEASIVSTNEAYVRVTRHASRAALSSAANRPVSPAPSHTASAGARDRRLGLRLRSSAATMWFEADNLVLTAAQAACVALPAAGVPRFLERFRGGAWALVLPLCIVVVIVAINEVPDTADVLTWVALLLVPPGCALALGWAAHGARWPLAPLAAVLLALAWADQDGSRVGELATIALIAGSAVTLGRLLGGAAPLTLLKLGLIALAVSDAILVFGNELQAPNAVLVAAAPGAGLPQLQSASFHFASLGYGDFFAAAVLGGILAVERRPQVVAMVAVLAVSLAWDQLFLVVDTLPATVPPAIVLVGVEIWARVRRRQPA